MRPTCTPKNFEKCIIWEFIEQEFKGVFICRSHDGSLFIKKQVVEKASLQNRNGTEA
jgi:hypothetical protein